MSKIVIIPNFQCECGSNKFIDSGDKYTELICNQCHTMYNKSDLSIIFQSITSLRKIRDIQNKQKEEEERIPKLIICPACNNQVSNQATSCPHCGQPINTKPRCPMCNSYDIKQVTGMERAMSVGFWGFASKKINKSFECKKCGHTW